MSEERSVILYSNKRHDLPKPPTAVRLVLVAVVEAVGVPVTELVTSEALSLTTVPLPGRAREAGEALAAVHLVASILAVFDAVTALERANHLPLNGVENKGNKEKSSIRETYRIASAGEAESFAAADIGRQNGVGWVESIRVLDEHIVLGPETVAVAADWRDGVLQRPSHSRLGMHVGEGEGQWDSSNEQHDEDHRHDDQRERGNGVDAGTARLR